MNDDEKQVFNQVLENLNIPEPDPAMKEKIMKAVYLLSVAKEIGAFHASIPGTLLDDSMSE
ncbi:MAG: hypothetical protein OEY80_02575 [Nitrospirota bacterium]|nr:hypothetical protein [Nitrospirota bacterium]MDH4359962.1 hypothetical protein [Nitrospirota bacterium]MDH5295602.1 hypothetical protein [Nitrospirota bacterium]MDH5574350.1 hypothetical protein [Nitrospirota bacterium]